MSLLSQNLQAFVSIVKTGTVHGAAAELNLTQTAVTQRIRAVEAELKTTLFTRSRKGMLLTQEGQSLLRYCKGSLDLEGEALSSITKAGLNEPVFLSLAGPTSVMTSRILQQTAGYYQQWPKVFLNLIITDTDDRLNLVKSGQATMAIVAPENVPNELDSKMLKPDKYILVASPKWKGRRLNDILENEKIIDFYESDQTTLNYLKKHDLISKIKNPRLFINNNEAIIQMFSDAVGFGTLTQEIAKPFLDSEKLITLNSGLIMEDPLALIWYNRPELPKYFEELLKVIR
ncbi:MAG: LysR family transcriptional regulator [Bdellovibrionaceae bacterium]|nr:LysR family transcriptional regulator [Pseudobdellovibrionaceae bacterium]